ncbi:MAG: TonB family protein [Gammaproteobacteria bacterium]|jgi:TonB family protein|nr:TonB family protein [Gammaproteobacteria bacterium]
MMQWQRKKSMITPLLLAISLHTICFIVLFAEWTLSQEQAGVPAAALDQVYLYSVKENNNRRRGKDEKTEAFTHRFTPLSSVLGEKGTIKKDKQTTKPAVKIAGSYSPEEKGDSELLRLIHNKIQEHHYYPANALSLSQSGTVWLQFVLNPDGRIEQIHLLQTSGIKSLDKAAITALEAASPLPIGRAQLSASAWFRIHLVYALPHSSG